MNEPAPPTNQTSPKQITLSSKNLEEWRHADYWKRLAPSSLLSLSEDDEPNERTTIAADPSLQQQRKKWESNGTQCRQALRNQGFALVNDFFATRELVHKLRKGIQHLHQLGYPASFILLYNETWELAYHSWNSVLKPSTHERNAFHLDILAWYIESNGFSPHRDRQPDYPPLQSFFQAPAEGTVEPNQTDATNSTTQPNGNHNHHQNRQGGSYDAMFVTHWIALTDATPENSCLYMIPKDLDPGYFNGDGMKDTTTTTAALDDENESETAQEEEEVDDDPLRVALSTKQSFQHIRCIPRQSGQSVLFTHRIIHWGSARPPYDETNQIRLPPCRSAISFVSCHAEFESPFLIDSAGWTGDSPTPPPFGIRLLLVCAQMLMYYQRFEFPKDFLKACYDYCKEHDDKLGPEYRQKVFCEFVKAMQEHQKNKALKEPSLRTTSNDATSRAIPDEDNHKDDDEEEEEEEAMMEEMLRAAQTGYGDFNDDYDEEFGAEENQLNDEDEDGKDEEEEEVFLGLGGKRAISTKDPNQTAKKPKGS